MRDVSDERISVEFVNEFINIKLCVYIELNI